MQLEFDYIIVGGGSAGCRIAERLSTQSDCRVALIEAGGICHDVRSVVPRWYLQLFGSRVDWRYCTEPVPGLGGRQILWPRGKLLGGSGAINALIYLQAAQSDFQRWGWDWAESLATEPLLPVSQPISPHPWSESFVAACSEWGLSTDHSLAWDSCAFLCPPIASKLRGCLHRAAPQTAGLFGTTQRHARRRHTGHSLLENTAERNNFTLLSDCQAENIALHQNAARGVIVRDQTGVRQTLRATREVIITAGTIGTPVLLMKSGIGPSQQLRGMGIACQIDHAGVGANLQDHSVVPLIFETHARLGLAPRANLQERQAYRESGSGSLASNIAEAGCLFAFPPKTDAANRIDAQIHFTPTHYLKFPNVGQETNHCTLAVTDLHPRSRGEVGMVRTAADDFVPTIQPNYFDAAQDLDRMIQAVETARELASQPSLRELIKCEQLPGAKRVDHRQLERAIRAYALSIYHPVGTCRMEAPIAFETPAVVDADFRVLQVDQLRIADASVLPELPSCNTNAVTVLIAERLAQLILATS